MAAHEQIAKASTIGATGYIGGARDLRSDAPHPTLRAVAEAIHRFFGRIRRWHEERETYRALMSLDDYVLRDIGISRSDIKAVSRGLWDEAPGSVRAGGARGAPGSRARSSKR
jgi:uncharacterized protein YjiS (DUF1127 family)